MAAYVTVEHAKRHLNIVDDAFNDLIDDKVEQASAEIGEYLKSQADVTWDTTTAPYVVQAATLLLVAHRYENRGDDMVTDAAVWQAIERLLMRRRDPALA